MPKSRNSIFVVFLTALTLVCLLPLSASGEGLRPNPEPTRKAPWEWTVEERIAARTNPQLAAERVRERGRRVQTSSASPPDREMAPTADSLRGKQDSHLFLPHEVFDELVKIGFGGDARSGQLVRRGLMPEVMRHGLPADFWDRLQAASAVFVADVNSVRDLLPTLRQTSGRTRQRAEDALALKHDDVCRSRVDALTAARKEFGSARFDRFLYEVIAVNMSYVADRLPEPNVLREAEGGCR